MLLVQFGHRTINMEYLVVAEDADCEPPPKVLPDGVVRVLVEGGRMIDFNGEQAARIRSIIAELANPQYAPAVDKPGRHIPSSRKPRKE